MKLPKNYTFCYADDVTLVVPYTESEDKNACYLQEVLDICTEWSEDNKLYFNVKKCQRISIGLRKEPTCDFSLCNQIITRTDKIVILGVIFTGRKSDPMEDMKTRSIRNGKLVFKKLKTFFSKCSFGTMKRLYTAYFVSKTLYGSELFEDFTILNETYTNNSKWRKTLDRLYIRMFAKKQPKQKDLDRAANTNMLVPLLPSQQCIVKSLTWIFKILGGRLKGGGIHAEDMLKINKFKTTLKTRSQERNIFENSVHRKEFHHEKLSILRRHKTLVLDILGKEGYEDILKYSNKMQKKKIEEFIGGINSKENQIRNSIRDGTLRENIVTFRQHLT